MQHQSQVPRCDSDRRPTADQELLDAIDRHATEVAREQLARARSELADDLTTAQQAELAELAANIATETLEPVREALRQDDFSASERRRLAALFLDREHTASEES